MNKFLDTIEHYWTDHKKAVIVVGVILILAIIA
jgi:predicted negative regulator of RcsB-dependent stress response